MQTHSFDMQATTSDLHEVRVYGLNKSSECLALLLPTKSSPLVTTEALGEYLGMSGKCTFLPKGKIMRD